MRGISGKRRSNAGLLFACGAMLRAPCYWRFPIGVERFMFLGMNGKSICTRMRAGGRWRAVVAGVEAGIGAAVVVQLAEWLTISELR